MPQTSAGAVDGGVNVSEIVTEITTRNMNDPLEVLRFLQQQRVKGRDLDVKNMS